MAAEFDSIHSVHRALAVGALDQIIPPAKLRPYLIHAIERGVKRELEQPLQAGKLLRMKKVGGLARPKARSEILDEGLLAGTD